MPEEKPMVPAPRTSRSLAVELMNTLKDPARNAFIEGAELVLDMSLDEGVLRDIPIVGQMAGLGRSLMSIPDRLFVLKLRRFVSELDGVPERKKKAFLETMERDGVFEKVGEKVLMIVDQLDDADKASLAGYVFRAYVTGRIDKDQFEILCSCIRLTRMIDLNAFLTYHDCFDRVDVQIARSLSQTGLVDMEIKVAMTIGEVGSPRTGVFYTVSRYGDLLFDLLKERKRDLEKQAAASPS